jgi:uncharacterized protein YggE
MALGTLGAIALLLGAFVVVWLMPREPGVGNASNQNTGSTTSSSGSTTDMAPVAKPSLSQAGAPNMAAVMDQPHVSVNGTGIISAKPDMVELRIGVQIQNNSLDVAQTEAADKMNAAMAQLKSAGVDDKDISTAQYNVEPVMDYRDNQPPVLSGYRVTNILSVKLRDISKAGKMVDDLVKSGANSVYGLQFSFSDPTALIRQAREQAMSDAKSKADQLAAAGGVTLGTPIVINEGSASVPPVVMEAMPANDMAQGRASGAAPPINPGQQEIRVEVQVVYGIK